MKSNKKVELGKVVTINFKKPYSGKTKICIYQKNLLDNQNRLSKDKSIVYVSPLAPLAQAIINHREGEKIKFSSSSCELEIEILKIDCIFATP